MVGPYEDTSLPLITHHVRVLWYKLCILCVLSITYYICHNRHFTACLLCCWWFIMTFFTGVLFFFFLGFSLYFLKTFNHRLITVHNRWVHSEVNCWPRDFFQSAGLWTWTRELLVKSKIATLRSSAQPLNQPHWVSFARVLVILL